MSQILPTTQSPSRPIGNLLLWLPLPAAAVALAVLAVQHPKLALVGTLAVPLLITAVKRPNAATMIVVFILYSNAATVAVHFHGVPLVVGASFSLLMLIPLTYYHLVRGEKLIVTPIIWLMFLFGLIQMIGAANAVHPDEALLDMAVFLTEGIGLYFLMINVIRTPQVLRGVLASMLLAGVAMAAVTLYQSHTGTFTNHYGGFAQIAGAERVRMMMALGYEVPIRVGGPLGGPNIFARILIMLLPIGMYFMWRKNSRSARWLAVLATVIVLAAAGLTKSRGAGVGLVMTLVILASVGYIELRRLLLVGIALSVVVIALPGYRARLSSMGKLAPVVTGEDPDKIRETDSSIRGRLTEMAAAALVAMDHPLIGVGPNNFRFHYREYAEKVGLRVKTGTRQAHCLYVGIAAETGFVGLAVFALIIFAVIAELVNARKRCLHVDPDMANLITMLLMVLVIYLTTGIVDDYAYIRYFWLIVALCSAGSRIGERAAERARSNVPSAPALAGTAS